jgi:hypothetical protein
MASAEGPLAQPAFIWLHDLLWPGGAPGAEGRPYAVIARHGRPRLIVPLGNRAALASLLGRTSGDVSTAQRLIRRAGSIGARFGILGPLLRTRFGSGATPGAVALEEYVARAVGLTHIDIAVTVGPPRPNAKPVLQLFTPDGATVGFAKIGWNGLTRDLVVREAEVLRTLHASPTGLIEPPRLLHLGQWRGLDVSILSPLEPPLDGAQRRDPSTDELVALADLGARTAGTLSDSSYGERLRSRVAALDSSRRHSYAAVLDRLERRAGQTRLEFGRAHGDWAPWNMAPLRDRLLVWDWERSAVDMPVLLDAVHYIFQREWLRRSRPPEEAVAAAREHAGTHAAAFGLDETAVDIIIGCYLLELALRYTENAAAGTDELRSERHGSVDAILDTFV